MKDRKTFYNGTYSYIDDTTREEPIFSFSNINQTNYIKNGISYNTKMTYLPIYENIDHLKTTNKTKIEYFFNKRDLMLSLKGSGVYGSGTASITIDNLKFQEVDMIPFFQYFKYENINRGVQIPNGIDYVRFDYNTNINYNYVSYTNIKSLNYFNINKFEKVIDFDDKYWIGKDDSINLNTNDFFNKKF